MTALPFGMTEDDALDVCGSSDRQSTRYSAHHGAELTIERTDDEALELRPFPTVQLMRGDPPEPPREHVEGLLADRDLTIFAGLGGSCKSPSVLTIAVCVAVKRDPFGFTLAESRDGGVLLIVPEDGQAFVRSAVDAISAGMDLQPGEREILAQRLVMVSDDAIVNLTTDARRLRDTALEHGAVLVVIDPLRNVLGGANENDSAVAGPVCDALRREVCRGAGASVVLVHHLSKPPRDGPADAAPSVHDVRGSGGWVAGCRLAFTVAKRENRVTLTSIKANRIANNVRHDLDLCITADPSNAARWLTCSLTDANAGASAQGASSQTLTPGVGRPINANERKALEAIDDQHEPDRRVSWSEWKGSAGMSEDTLKSVKRRLLDAQLARAIEAGTHRNGGKTYSYSITDRGRNCLSTGMIEGERVRG